MQGLFILLHLHIQYILYWQNSNLFFFFTSPKSMNQVEDCAEILTQHPLCHYFPMPCVIGGHQSTSTLLDNNFYHGLGCLGVQKQTPMFVSLLKGVWLPVTYDPAFKSEHFWLPLTPICSTAQLLLSVVRCTPHHSPKAVHGTELFHYPRQIVLLLWTSHTRAKLTAQISVLCQMLINHLCLSLSKGKPRIIFLHAAIILFVYHNFNPSRKTLNFLMEETRHCCTYDLKAESVTWVKTWKGLSKMCVNG